MKKKLTKENVKEFEIHQSIKKIKGVLKFPANFDYKQELVKALVKHFGR